MGGPPITDATVVRGEWNVPLEFQEKQVSSVKELRKLLGREDVDSVGFVDWACIRSEIYGYSDRHGGVIKVAYMCGHCNELITGPPRINDYRDRGEVGVNVDCCGCYNPLETKVSQNFD